MANLLPTSLRRWIYEDEELDMPRVFEDLTLLLIYLSSWREKVIRDIWVTRSWKGYDFDVLDRLMEKGYISSSRGAKSVILTDEGIKEAERLKAILLRAVSKTYGKEGGGKRRREKRDRVGKVEMTGRGGGQARSLGHSTGS